MTNTKLIKNIKTSNHLKTHRPNKCPRWQLALTVFGAVAAFFLWSRNPTAMPIEVARNQIPPSNCETPPWLIPYKGSDTCFPPVSAQPQEHHLMRAGAVYLDKSRLGYVISERDLQATHKHKLKKAYEDYEFFMGIEAYREQVAEAHKIVETDFSTNGMQNLYHNDGVLISVNPHVVKQHKQADAHMRSWMEKTPFLSATEITKELIQSHQVLFKGSGLEGPQFRKINMAIFREQDTEQTFENWIDRVKQQGTREELQILKSKILPKFTKPEFPGRSEFSENELRIAEYFVHLPPEGREVKKLMLEFAAEFKKSYLNMMQCKSTFDPIAFASWAHRRLGEIHPFLDGSGRMSRLLLNNVLKLAGHPPVVFPNDDEYVEATIKDQKTPGSFANYLRTQVIPWNQEQFGPDKPCLEQVTC